MKEEEEEGDRLIISCSPPWLSAGISPEDTFSKFLSIWQDTIIFTLAWGESLSPLPVANNLGDLVETLWFRAVAALDSLWQEIKAGWSWNKYQFYFLVGFCLFVLDIVVSHKKKGEKIINILIKQIFLILKWLFGHLYLIVDLNYLSNM